MPTEFVAAGNIDPGDIIKIAGQRGEFRVRKTKGVDVECFGPLPGTGGVKIMPKMRTFVEEKVLRIVRKAAEEEARHG